jgi:hypothetical protein
VTIFHAYLVLLATLHTIDQECAKLVQDFTTASKWTDIDVEMPTDVEGLAYACNLLLHLMVDRMFFGPSIENFHHPQQPGSPNALDTISGRLLYAKRNFRAISQWIQNFGSMHPILNDFQKEICQQLASYNLPPNIPYPTICTVAMIIGRHDQGLFAPKTNRKTPGLPIREANIREKLLNYALFSENPYFSVEKCSEVLYSNNGSIDGKKQVFTTDSLKGTILENLLIRAPSSSGESSSSDESSSSGESVEGEEKEEDHNEDDDDDDPNASSKTPAAKPTRSEAHQDSVLGIGTFGTFPLGSSLAGATTGRSGYGRGSSSHVAAILKTPMQLRILRILLMQPIIQSM